MRQRLQQKSALPVHQLGQHSRGLAQDRQESDDNCSEMPDDVAELIVAEGTA